MSIQTEAEKLHAMAALEIKRQLITQQLQHRVCAFYDRPCNLADKTQLELGLKLLNVRTERDYGCTLEEMKPNTPRLGD